MIGDDYFTIRAQLGTALYSLHSLVGELETPAGALSKLHQLQQSLRDPFFFIAIGSPGTGKYPLLDALFAKRLFAPGNPEECVRARLFKYGDGERDTRISDVLEECYRPAPFLRDFHIVDTPASGPVLREHQLLTEHFIPLADLILVVIGGDAPESDEGWDILRLIEPKWFKNVVVVLQKSELGGAEAAVADAKRLGQMMLEKTGDTCPIFPVAAAPALTARLSRKATRETISVTGIDRLEAFIDARIVRAPARLATLRAACDYARAVLQPLGDGARETAAIITRDGARLEDFTHDLADCREQSLRQIGGVLWTLAQNYEKAQKRSEDLLTEKLTVANAVQLVFHRGGWRRNFQIKIDERLRSAIQQQVEASITLLDDDLREVWQRLHGSFQKLFSETVPAAETPAFLPRRDALLARIDDTLLASGSDAQIDAQLERHLAQTARWLRLILAAVVVSAAASFAAIRSQLPLPGNTGVLAGLAAVSAFALAVWKRQQILREFRRQMRERREAVLGGIEDHLRGALATFYGELTALAAPRQTALAASRKQHEPLHTRLRQLDELFTKASEALGAARPAELPKPQTAPTIGPGSAES